MSHEGTTGTLEAIPSEMVTVVQALASEPNTPVTDAKMGVPDADVEKGTTFRAMEATLAEVDGVARERDLSAAATQLTVASVGKDRAAGPATENVATQVKEPVSERQERADMGTAATAMAPREPPRAKETATKARLKSARTKKAPTSGTREKSRAVQRKGTGRAAVAKADAKPRKAKAIQELAARKVQKAKPRRKPLKLTVPEVWRSIVKKNERQGDRRYDVLVCQHAVPANDNTYRVARACPECRARVQAYADGLAASPGPKVPRRRKV